MIIFLSLEELHLHSQAALGALVSNPNLVQHLVSHSLLTLFHAVCLPRETPTGTSLEKLRQATKCLLGNFPFLLTSLVLPFILSRPQSIKSPNLQTSHQSNSNKPLAVCHLYQAWGLRVGAHRASADDGFLCFFFGPMDGWMICPSSI